MTVTDRLHEYPVWARKKSAPVSLLHAIMYIYFFGTTIGHLLTVNEMLMLKTKPYIGVFLAVKDSRLC